MNLFTPILLNLLVFVNFSLTCPTENEVPEITSTPEYIGGQGSKVEEIGTEILICKAGYPTEWSFEGPMPAAFSVKRTRKFLHHNASTLITACFESVLSIEKDSGTGHSGNYTCRSVSEPMKSSTSLYRFYFDDGFAGLFNARGEVTIDLARKTSNNEFIIPCPANYEKINASLVKFDEEGDDTPLNEEPLKLRYDPKIGFLLNATAYPNPVGRYKCLGNFGKTNYKKFTEAECEIEIKMTDDVNSFSPKQHYVVVRRNENTTLTCESTQEVEFLKKISKSIKIISEHENYKLNRIRKYVAKIILQGIQGIAEELKGEITCRTKENKTEITSWSFDEKENCECLWKKYTYERSNNSGTFICRTGTQSKIGHDHSHSFSICNNPSECRMTRRCPNELNCRLASSDYFGHVGPFTKELSFGYIKCSVQDYRKPQGIVDFAKFEMHMKQYHYEEKVISVRTRVNVKAVGDKQEFTCTYDSRFLVPETQWAFQMKNGTFQFLKDVPLAESSINAYDSNPTPNALTTVDAMITISDKNIQYVYCFATNWEINEVFNASTRVLVTEVEKPAKDPEKAGCVDVYNNPKIIMRRGLEETGYNWEYVTGKDIIQHVNEPAIELVCVSKALTEWRLNGVPILYNSRKIIVRLSQASPICYQDALTLYLYETDVGNYTCNEIHNHEVRSSTFLFVKGNTQNLADHGKHERIGVNTKIEHTVLPCKANDPTVNVQLTRHKAQGDIDVLNQDESIQYNPKIGFTVLTSILLDGYDGGVNITDVYVCSTILDDDDFEAKENHVFYSLFTFTDSHGEMSSMDLLCEENGGVNVGAVVVPWILVALLCLINIGFFIVVRHKMSRSAGGSIVHFNANSSPTSPELGVIPAAQDTGIVNSAYEKFH